MTNKERTNIAPLIPLKTHGNERFAEGTLTH